MKPEEPINLSVSPETIETVVRGLVADGVPEADARAHVVGFARDVVREAKKGIDALIATPIENDAQGRRQFMWCGRVITERKWKPWL